MKCWMHLCRPLAALKKFSKKDTGKEKDIVEIFKHAKKQ